jgi:hypothetical protein
MLLGVELRSTSYEINTIKTISGYRTDDKGAREAAGSHRSLESSGVNE